MKYLNYLIFLIFFSYNLCSWVHEIEHIETLCDISCDGGACLYNNCDYPSCNGGACKFINCYKPTCQGIIIIIILSLFLFLFLSISLFICY